MITISKKVEYSIIFISYLAKHKGKTVSLTDVARKTVMPYGFWGSCRALKSGGLIDSREERAAGIV